MSPTHCSRCRRSLLATLFALIVSAAALAAQDRAEGGDAARRLAAKAMAARTSAQIVMRKANETCVPNLILCGQLVQSTLATTDCSTSGGFADLWFFPNYTRQAVGSALSSPDFDVLLGLADPDNNVLAADEAPAGGIASVGAFLSSFGNFKLLAAAQDSSVAKTGNYTINLLCSGSDASLCAADVATMCLQQDRFRIQVGWHNQFDNTYGFGRAIRRTDTGGFFSFGDPNNIELLVKVLDFGGGVFKVFYGELTDLEFSIAISDMDDPLQFTRTYTNTAGNCGGIDQDFLNGKRAEARPRDGAASGGCRPDKSTICLLGGRFTLTMDWHNQFDGTSGAGGAVPISDLTGSFFFSDKTDLELVAKVIDFGDRIAVFYGTLSDLQYDLTVTDTTSGMQKVYHNAPGNYCGGLDNTAFP
jgi:hypothetical protein